MTILFAILAAAANGTASALQRRAAGDASPDLAFRPRLIAELVRHPIWLAGIGSLLAGFLLQALALRHGALALVEPLLVLELPLALLVGGALFHRRLPRRDWLAVAVVTGGLGTMLAAANPHGGGTDAPTWRWTLVIAADLGLMALLVSAAAGTRGDARAALLGAASGFGWGLSASLIKAVSAIAGDGAAALFGSWKTYAMVGIGCVSLFLFQNAVQAGRLLAAQPAITISDPLVSVILGLLLFGERVRTGPYLVPAFAGALAVAGGAVMLSRSALLDLSATQEGDAGGGPGGRTARRSGRPGSEPVPVAEAPPVLERLLDDILAFWDERIVDPAGGYRLGHDVDGRPLPTSTRHLVTQARTAWFFARLSRSPYGEDRHLQWAAHGVRYLRETMWDHRHGGFRWAVADGRPVVAEKHLYGQAFGILALAEFARAARDGEAAALAGELFELLDGHAHDGLHGGYAEARTADWSAPAPGEPTVLGLWPDRKTVNTHLHLLEAFSDLALLRPEPRLAERLGELIAVLVGRTRPIPGSWGDVFSPDWVVRRDWRSSYGHDVEAAWLLEVACAAAGISPAALAPVASAVWDHALAHGYDRRRGGFYSDGRPGRRASAREKQWWVQAEALVGSLVMAQRGDERCREAFEATLGWVDRVQADRVNGDWHAVIDRRGRASGDKSGQWKGPYHQGRAVLVCLEALAGERAAPATVARPA